MLDEGTDAEWLESTQGNQLLLENSSTYLKLPGAGSDFILPSKWVGILLTNMPYFLSSGQHLKWYEKHPVYYPGETAYHLSWVSSLLATIAFNHPPSSSTGVGSQSSRLFEDTLSFVHSWANQILSPRNLELGPRKMLNFYAWFNRIKQAKRNKGK